ncbi:hypothetical protein PR202_ga14961 [Eleusine coracana subsp. coracana]|uniref:Uncharacterized protein n=1 Tax=Eleusine coracana subsp. coracana TaxID=191504 RepID=A0AAV5CIR5_ELECO|nr:hypothetical protein PR202_ga14961 [Eleusine coracana subsp. coracana]
MGVAGHDDPLLGETTCGSLLQQLQQIWDEVGESDDDRDKMLLQLEQECLDVYRRKVEQASSSRARLLQQLANSKSELARLVSALGDLSISGIMLRGEIAGNLKVGDHLETPHVNEDDLSVKKLNEFLSELQALQKEKSNRLHKVLEFVSSVHDLCSVLGMDFLSTVTEVHPSLDDSIGVQSKSITDETLSKLSKMVIELNEEKAKRFAKIQALASQLSDLWNLMDAPVEERQPFHHVSRNLSVTLDEVILPGALAIDVLQQAELEVERLDQLKASRMKDIAFKKQTELEDIYAQAHIAIDSSAARDRIIYSATRGAHLNLKRAEKARVLVNKIPGIVDTLISKTRVWEQEHDMPFTYDGVPLLAMLDEYKILRQEKEEEKRRMRDQKKINDQLAAEQEKLFGSKPSPARPQSSRKVAGARVGSGAANGTPVRRLSALQSGGRTVSRDGRKNTGRPSAPVNYVAIAKEDAASQVSSNHTGPCTP